MFEYEKFYKKFEELVKQSQQATDFWFNALLSSAKEFYSKK
jgi:hypothetical protein